MAQTKLSAKEAAREIGTDARTLRKFIRSSDQFDACGQGNRYEFTSAEVKKLKKAFIAWSASASTKTASEKPKNKKGKEPVPPMTHEVEDVEEIDLTDEDMEDDPHPHRTTGDDEVMVDEFDTSEFEEE